MTPSATRRPVVHLAVALVALFALLGTTGCKPAPVKCKVSMHKYDHKTGPFTWFTLFNEMRFCYNGSTATSITWATNRTSSPSFPYTSNGVSSSTGLETYGDGAKVKRARNVSYHNIGCAKVMGGFTVTMRQFGYGSGNVTTARSSINSSKDC